MGFAVAADDDDDDDSSCLIGTYVDFPKIVQCDKIGEEMDWYGVWYACVRRMFKFQVCHCWLPPRVDVHVSAVKFPSCEAAWRREARLDVFSILSCILSWRIMLVLSFVDPPIVHRTYASGLNFYIFTSYELRVSFSSSVVRSSGTDKYRYS